MTPPDPRPAEGAASDLHRAFWRWHFYAGLVVMPVLMLMALTGGLYLFKDEIEGLVYRPLLVTPPAAASTPPRAWADAARLAVPGRLVQLSPPADATQSARLVIETPQGARRAVYVDPAGASVLGSTPDGGLMQTIKRLHSLDLAGPIFNLLIEVVAGWAIVMVATGVVLWWPRGRAGPLKVRGDPAQRVFWRDLHALVGLFAGGIILFLAVTGMPWSAVWGKQVRGMINEAGLGRPDPPAGAAAAWSHGPSHPSGSADAPWALRDAEMRTHHRGQGLSLDGAVARVDAAGLPRPYLLTLPNGPGGTWSAAHMPDRVQGMRTLYLDGTDGRVVADIGYGQFGAGAKAVEWVIAVHQGRQFGSANRLVMLAGCVAIWLLGTSALVMWWKRRPKGRFAAPAGPANPRAYAALGAVVLPIAILYPLVGASLAVVLALDLIVRRIALSLRRPPKART